MVFKSKYPNLPTPFTKKIFDRSGNKLTLFRPWMREISEPHLSHLTFCLSFINGLCYFITQLQYNCNILPDGELIYSFVNYVILSLLCQL